MTRQNICTGAPWKPVIGYAHAGTAERERPTGSRRGGPGSWWRQGSGEEEPGLKAGPTRKGRPLLSARTGDDPRWDIVGPQAVGMEAILIDRRPQMLPDVLKGVVNL